MKSDFGKTAAETACKQEKIHLHACRNLPELQACTVKIRKGGSPVDTSTSAYRLMELAAISGECSPGLRRKTDHPAQGGGICQDAL